METKYIKCFLASSSELELERVYIGDLFNDICAALGDLDLRVKLLKWENFDASFSRERKQSEYNYKVRESDVFLALFYNVAGRYTVEEIDTAMEEASGGRDIGLSCLYKEGGKENFDEVFIKSFKEFSKFDIAGFDKLFIKGCFDCMDKLRMEVIKLLIPYLTKAGIECKLCEDYALINKTKIK